MLLYCAFLLPENQGVGKWSWFYWALYPTKVGNGELEFVAKNSHVDSRMGMNFLFSCIRLVTVNNKRLNYMFTKLSFHSLVIIFNSSSFN